MLPTLRDGVLDCAGGISPRGVETTLCSGDQTLGFFDHAAEHGI